MTSAETLSRPGYLADTATGLPIPGEPAFDSPADERRHRKQRLAAAIRVFGKLGYGEGIAGHISVRDPQHAERFWVNPFGVSFNRVRVRDLICVDGEGNVVEGTHRVNPSAFAIHSQIHLLVHHHLDYTNQLSKYYLHYNHVSTLDDKLDSLQHLFVHK